MNRTRNFTQAISFDCESPEVLIGMLREWDEQQAAMDAMGYMGTRLLADRECLDRYVMIVEFGVVDPDVSAADEAMRNNRREETKAFAARLRELVRDEPTYHHFDELYRTDF